METPQANRNFKLTTNVVANMLGFIARVVITFLLTPILIRGLGDQRYGIWSLVESVLAYLSLFDLGIVASLVRYAARYQAQQDWKNFNRIVNTCFLLNLGIGMLVLIVTAVLAFAWPPPSGVPDAQVYEFRLLLLLFGASLAIRFPLGSFAGLLDSLGRYPAKVSIRTFWSVVSAVLLILSVRAGHGLLTVGVILTSCYSLEGITLALMAWHSCPQLRVSPFFADMSTFRLIRGYSVFSFLAMIAGRISFQTDAIVIGAFLAPQFITPFAIASRLVEFGKDAFRSISVPFFPVISSLEGMKDEAAIHRLFLSGSRSLFWSALPIEVGFLVLGRDFLQLWVGQDHVDSAYPILVVLSVPVVSSVAQLVAAKVLYGMGNLRSLTIVLLLEALVNLGLSIALVRNWGILGVAVGTAVPNLIANVVVIVIVCRLLHVDLREYVLSVCTKPLILGCILASLWIVSRNLLEVTSYGRFIVLGSVGSIAYGVLAICIECGPRRTGAWIRRACFNSM